MSLEIVEASGLATIQDGGRTGWMRFGIPRSGAMDSFACQAANALLSNPLQGAVVEIGAGDIQFRALQDCVIAVTGFGYDVSVYLWEFPLWSSYFVRAGWEIRLHKRDSGMWAYLAIAGGIQIQPVLGSCSTYVRGAFGGLDGRLLKAGDLLRSGHPSAALSELAARTLPEPARPAYRESPTLDVLLGPQTGFFTAASLAIFLSQEYTVSTISDRMGYRLDGPALAHRSKSELISEGMVRGAIQVPANGQPIVMMADGPTAGGYPKIGTVASADLPLFVQCMPGKSRVRFRETTVESAQARYRALMSGLQRIVDD